MKPKISVLGGLNMDMIMNVHRLPNPGETLMASALSQAPGGKGGNQAAAASRMGAAVELFGAVGEDSFGEVLLGRLKGMGVNTDCVFQVKDVSTGIALINVAPDGQNTICFFPGANGTLIVSSIPEIIDVIEKTDLFLVQNENPLEFVEGIVAEVHALGKPVVFNSAPAEPMNSTFLGQCDIIIANETEAEVITGLKVDTESECEKAADFLLSNGSRGVIITLGARGAYFKESDMDNGRLLPAPKVNSVEAVGAGDIFCGAFAVRYAMKESMDKAIQFANHAAALSTTKPGIYPSIPTSEETEEFMNNSGKH